MGNKLVRRRQVVEEKYTRPQGLYQLKDVDQKKLKKLILDSKLAPCYPGDEDCTFDLEECPICFLYYPCLNRSKCCMKGICTECFLQMKPQHSTCPTPCPFCKTSNYIVEYRGMRSKEEKGMEQVEEQRVIEAKIRMQQQEFLDEEERVQRRQEISSSSNIMTSGEVGYMDVSSSSLAAPSVRFSIEGDEIISSQGSCTMPTMRQLSNRQNGDDQFDLDLDDIMMMEAIWLSIQENETERHLVHGSAAPADEPFDQEDHSLSPTVVSLAEARFPSGGLACAIAAFAERQNMDGDSTKHAEIVSAFNTNLQSERQPNGEEMMEASAPESWIEVSPDSGRAMSREDGDDHGFEVAEAGTSYSTSDETVEAGGAVSPIPDGIEDRFQTNIVWPILPESFEEQMMLAMAISLAEAQARTNTQGVSWL